MARSTAACSSSAVTSGGDHSGAGGGDSPLEEELLIVDLGAGCGLLSLLAARAAAVCGACVRVLAVERERPVAQMAREIFGANRQALPEGVTLQVIEADSGALCLGGALPRRADIVVSEVLGDDPLAEGVLLALHHAHTHLLAHGGEMLPSALSVVAALVAMPTAADLATLRPAVGGRHGGPLRLLEPGRVGTDLRQHGAPASASASASSTSAWEYVTRPAVVWRCRLGELPMTGDASASLTAVQVVSAAVPTALCFWFEAELSEGAPLLSSSPSSRTHWRQMLVPLPEEAQRVPLQPGSHVTLRAMLAAHDEFQVELMPLPSSADAHGDCGDVCEQCKE